MTALASTRKDNHKSLIYLLATFKEEDHQHQHHYCYTKQRFFVIVPFSAGELGPYENSNIAFSLHQKPSSITIVYIFVTYMATTTINDATTKAKTKGQEQSSSSYQFGMRMPMSTKHKIDALKGPYLSQTKFILRAIDQAIAQREEEAQKGVRGLDLQSQPPTTTTSLLLITPPQFLVTTGAPSTATTGAPSAVDR